MKKTMKAVISTAYGGPEVLKVQDTAVPVLGDNDILVANKASSVTAAHGFMRTGYPLIGRLFLGFFKPKNKISGTDFSGTVVAFGNKVTSFKIGDQIFGSTDIDGGTYAEYVRVSESDIILPVPANVSHLEAAGMIEGASTAYAFIKNHTNIGHGSRVLINGASGSVGLAALQIIKNLGANVTAVSSLKNKELLMQEGADAHIDYTEIAIEQWPEGYDVIFDCVGKLSYNKTKRLLNDKGLYLTTVLSLSNLWNHFATRNSKGKRCVFSATGLRDKKIKSQEFKEIQLMMAEGKLNCIIDKVYNIHEIQEAHRYVDSGRKVGNVVIKFN